MGKEVFIKTIQFFKNPTSNKETCTRSPENVGSVVILTFIFFDGFENSTSTVRITIFINETACSSSVFEMVFFMIVQQFRLDNSCFWFRLKGLNNRSEPIRCHFNITVQETIDICIDMLECHVITFGISVITTVFNHIYRCEI